jgi:hypothetical protein
MFKRWNSGKKNRSRSLSTPVSVEIKEEEDEVVNSPETKENEQRVYNSDHPLDRDKTTQHVSFLPITLEKESTITSEKAGEETTISKALNWLEKATKMMFPSSSESFCKISSYSMPNILGDQYEHKKWDNKQTRKTKCSKRSRLKMRLFLPPFSQSASMEELNSVVSTILSPSSITGTSLDDESYEYNIPEALDKVSTAAEEEDNDMLVAGCILEEALRKQVIDESNLINVQLSGRLPLVDEILREEHISAWVTTLPDRYQLYRNWKLLYSTVEHGMSLRTLYYRNRNFLGPTMLAILDMDGCLFGCFASEAWKLREGYYGNGECYLWKRVTIGSLSTEPSKLKRDITAPLSGVEEAESGTTIIPIEVYRSTGANSCYMSGTKKYLAMGCGNGVMGLWLDDHLYHGTSQPCSTFNNEMLACNQDFICCRLEVWGLTP